MDIRHDESVQIRNETPRGPWPEDSLARVPYWVYQDEPNYKREMRQIFEAATWNFVCLEADIPNKGDYRTNQIGEMPSAVVIGSRIGAVSSMSARPSSTEPSNSSSSAMMTMVVTGPLFMPCTSEAICSARPVKLMKAAKISAPMMTT